MLKQSYYMNIYTVLGFYLWTNLRLKNILFPSTFYDEIIKKKILINFLID